MNDLPLPSSFVQLATAIGAGAWPRFVLRWKVDAYGDPFDNDLEIVLTDDDPEFISEASRLYLDLFLVNEKQGQTGATGELSLEPAAELLAANKPSFILAVTDFTRIICFGRGRGNSLYCFDYRTSPPKPSVICSENSDWRRVAPDFRTFLGLYKLAPNRFPESVVGYWEMEEARIARTAEVLSRIGAG